MGKSHKKVAIVYDRVNKWGGAERVLLALHELFPKAPLYTSVYNPKKAPWAKVFTVKTSFLQHIPFASSFHEFFAFLMPIAFEQFSFDRYDLVISVTSEAAKGIITKPTTKHICFCLTPTRYLWSGYGDYFVDPIFRFISLPVVAYLRFWDKVAATRPDYYAAISKEVQMRIQKFYGRDSKIVFPPLTLLEKNIDKKRRLSNKNRTQQFFLVVSRLVPYKRIDIAIEACTALSYPLIVVGSGSEERRLKTIAGSSVTFVSGLTDEELVEYYKNCRALIFPGEEDFGLAAVEAQSFGKPVIAYKKGGVAEIVKDGKTGMFFHPQSAVALQGVLKRFSRRRFARRDCQEQVNKFSKDIFKKELLRIFKNII